MTPRFSGDNFICRNSAAKGPKYPICEPIRK
jgi:hypothetical protein